MNDANLLPPCAEYEFDLVDLCDGSLAPDRARAVRAHVDSCSRCRGWLESFATLDARLAEHLPRPDLSADFAARLEARLSAEQHRTPARDLRAAADDEYTRMVAALRRGAQRNFLLAGLASAVLIVAALVVAPTLLAETGPLLGMLTGQERAVGLGALGGVVALAGLGWSAIQGSLPFARVRA